MQLKDLDAFELPWPTGTGEDDPMARIGLRVELIFRDGYDATARRGALMTIIDQYIDFAADRLKLYQRSGDRRPRKITAGEPLDLSPLRTAAARDNSDFSLFLSGEAEVGKASHWSLATVASHNGYLLMHFPLQAFEGAAPNSFRTLFQKWCSELATEQAYAGLGLVLPTGGMVMDEAIGHCGPIVTRFSGLDVDLPDSTARSCKDGIRCVAWLTAINSKWLQRAGGADAVLRVAGPTVTSLPYNGGTIFVAGQAPDAGDRERGRVPSANLALGRALAPIRSPYKEPLFKVPPGYKPPPAFNAGDVGRRVEPEELPALHYTQQWMSRFG